MTRPPRSLTELRFAALLQYSPDGEGSVAEASREHVRRIKRGSPAHIERIGLRAAEWAATGAAAEFFRDALLVPVPRSKPFKDVGALWPAMRIAEELVRRGLGRDVLPLLRRVEPIEKSALQRDGAKRPGPEDHVRTIQIVDPLRIGRGRVVLVDDVITRGATMLGCATVVERALPGIDIAAFAAVRTMTAVEIERMLAPVTGVISMDGGRPHREP